MLKPIPSAYGKPKAALSPIAWHVAVHALSPYRQQGAHRLFSFSTPSPHEESRPSCYSGSVPIRWFHSIREPLPTGPVGVSFCLSQNIMPVLPLFLLTFHLDTKAKRSHKSLSHK